MTFFVIFVIAVIIIIYLSKKSNQKNEISKHQQLQDNINRQRNKIKDYLEEEEIKIRVKEETQDIEGVEYNLVNVEAKGFFFGIEKKNTPTKKSNGPVPAIHGTLPGC